MYELIALGKGTYYADQPVKAGVYVEDGAAYLIDSGNGKESARQIFKALEQKGWTLKAIVNTHAHADHIGGNHYLQGRVSCPAVASAEEAACIRTPRLEPTLLYGGYPWGAACNRFLVARPSAAIPLEAFAWPEGLSHFPLPGHSLAMIGLKTSDGVVFLADAVLSARLLGKYPIPFTHDVGAHLETLDALLKLEGRCFVPAHAEAVEDVRPLVVANRARTLEIAGRILDACSEPADSTAVLKRLFDGYGIAADLNQYLLSGSTVRSYLAYLADAGELSAGLEDNRLLWRRL